MFHAEGIEQSLEVAARNANASNDTQRDFLSLLATLRRAFDADPLPCRHGVRFVLLIIYLSPHFPPYTNHFLSTVKRNPSIDLLLYASAGDCLEIKFRHEHRNVRIHCAHPNSIFFLIADGLCSQWKCSASDFHEIFVYFKTIISRFSYRLAHVKPMLASIFRRYLPCYTHWAFGDVDLWYGDFEKLYPTALARRFDVVTFPTFPYDRLYMQGQLTIFKNEPRLVSLWTQMKRFSSAAAFASTMEDDSWMKQTVTEGDFSAIIIDDENITWIRIPGFHVADYQLARTNAVVSVTADTPPSLTVRRAIPVPSNRDYTVLDDTVGVNARATQLLYGSVCEKQDWIRVFERRCISDVQNQSRKYGVVVMREPDWKQVVSSVIPLGTKEYLIFHLHLSKRTYNWTTIPTESAFRLCTEELATTNRSFSSFH